MYLILHGVIAIWRWGPVPPGCAVVRSWKLETPRSRRTAAESVEKSSRRATRLRTGEDARVYTDPLAFHARVYPLFDSQPTLILRVEADPESPPGLIAPAYRTPDPYAG